MIRKFLKFSVLVEIEPAVFEGRKVWKATSPTLAMVGYGDSPDDASNNIYERITKAEYEMLTTKPGSQKAKAELLKTDEEKAAELANENESAKELTNVELNKLGKTALKEYAIKQGFDVTPSMTKGEVIKLLVGEEADVEKSDEFDFDETTGE